MKKKKNKPSAFMSFLKEYQEKKERIGIKMNLQAAQENAGNLWSKMSEADKEIYKKKAKDFSFCSSKSVVIKLTNTGQSIDEVDQRRKQRETAETEMRNEIENILETAKNLGSI